MFVPSYKIIYLSSHTVKDIAVQVRGINFSSCPVVFHVLNLGDNQAEAIINLEAQLGALSVGIIPYGVYIVGEYAEYDGHFDLLPSQNLLPALYKQKSKNLNSKENSLLKKIELKKEKFKSIQNKDFLPVINKYAKEHKNLNILFQENTYLEHILTLLAEE